MPIMKAEKKFECRSAKIQIVMCEMHEPKLYKVIESPKSKKAKWHEEIQYFDYSEEANKHFLELVTYWCR